MLINLENNGTEEMGGQSQHDTAYRAEWPNTEHRYRRKQQPIPLPSWWPMGVVIILEEITRVSYLLLLNCRCKYPLQ